MARKSKYEKHKPGVFRHFQEGFSAGEVLRIPEYSKIPSSTIYDWAKEFKLIQSLGHESGFIPEKESIPEARLRLKKIDPEDPIQRVINALWDIVDDPSDKGANVAVQACNTILKGIAMQYDIASKQESEEDEAAPEPAEINIAGHGEA